MSDESHTQIQRRLCDYCNQSTALLYCRADSAKLCFSCDREVHSANQLFTKHSRSLLCDACNESPASLFCETEQSVFCSNCDWERHSCSLHHRRPVEVFTGCPSVSELLSFLGIEDLGNDKASCWSEEDDGFLDFLIWECPLISGFDGVIVPNDMDHGFKATDVPPLPKNRNSSCGQHKEEIFHQLHELAKSDPTLTFQKTDLQSLIPETDHFQAASMQTSCKNDAVPVPCPALEVAFSFLLPVTSVANTHVDCSRNIDVNDGPEDQQMKPQTGERETAISRYKEKKKTRTRAESRTRIKGRFAKVKH
ncbi:hypothetical protein V6Z11_1Z025500 [Gossypium hirsutum]